MSVQPIPDRCRSITPYLIVPDAAAAIEFYKSAFGAVEVGRLTMPDGSVCHAEIMVGDSLLMLAGGNAAMKVAWPEEGEWPTVTIHHYVEDVDAAWQRAVDAGAKPVMPLTQMFWGDRYGQLADPFHHRWSLAQHVEDVSFEEMQKRGNEMFKQKPPC